MKTTTLLSLAQDLITFRNGQETTTPSYQEFGAGETTRVQSEARKNNAKADNAQNKGLHEPWWWYDDCN